MAEIEKNIGKLEGIIEGIDNSLIKIEKALYGNGQPGAMTRITKIEENLESLSETTKTNNESIGQLAKSVSELKQLVLDHQKDEKIHTIKGILFRKETLLFIVIVCILVNAFMPAGLSLWTILSGLIGI